MLAIAQANDSSHLSAARDAAIDVLNSLEPVSEPDHESSPSFLADAGVRSEGVSAGSHVAHLGTSVARFELAEALERPRLQLAELRTLVFVEREVGSMAMLTPTGFVDPDAAQVAAGPPGPDAILDERPDDADSFESWLEATVTVTDSGSTTIGGHDAVWWDVAVDDAVLSVDCGPRLQSGVGRCVDLLAADVVRFVSDKSESRLIWVRDADIVVHLLTVEGGSIEAVVDVMAPLLNALVLTPT